MNHFPPAFFFPKHLSFVAEDRRLGQIFTTLFLKIQKVIIQNDFMLVFSILEMEENTFSAPNKIVFKLLGENLSEEQMALNHQTPQFKKHV